ncbi:hypothetical protein BFP97_16345 [Roseivirga sp. 4D4]|uniref:Calx-beta domain-containing protein n=1 Tax=Roseivirga sp. 4D4 TaxID=1889784 RepID=UPI000853B0CD|nr:Calx-beta domain-containing protein [Roseivirga sp. 4D4]OEK02996.1 hypothetical protein BFP97_16345 [Roseivirga sp. 4D4]
MNTVVPNGTNLSILFRSYLVFSLLLLCGFANRTHGQTTIDFDENLGQLFFNESLPVSFGEGSNTLNFALAGSGTTIVANSTGQMRITTFSGDINDYSVTITRTDGANFGLQLIEVNNSLTFITENFDYLITGRNDGSVVASATFETSPTGSHSFDLSAISDFDNIDEFIITFNASRVPAQWEFLDITILDPLTNTAPTATPPTAPIVNKNDTNVALADDIQVSDSDGDDQTVTFTVTGGTVTLGATGITFGGNGNGSASFTAAGTLADINAALDAATFTPIPGVSGTNAGTISFTTNDGTESSAAAQVSFDILNTVPTATAPTAPVVNENDTNVALADDIQVSDSDGDDQTVTFTVTGGTVNLGSTGITFGGDGNGSASFTAAGTLADINTALDAATFTPTPGVSGTNAGTISFTTNDGTESSAAAEVTFNIITEGTVTVTFDEELGSLADGNHPISANDGTNTFNFLSEGTSSGGAAGNGSLFQRNGSMEVAVLNTSVSSYEMTVTRVDGASFDLESLTLENSFSFSPAVGQITGQRDGVNVASANFSLSNDPNDPTQTSLLDLSGNDDFNNIDTFIIDFSGSLSVPATWKIHDISFIELNVAPTVSAPSVPTVSEDDTNVELADDIQVSDLNGDDQTVSFTVSGGTVTLGTAGITFGGNGNGSASFTAAGTLAAINTALDATTFTPNPDLSGANAGSISFTANDGIIVSDAATVTFDIVAVNDAPTFTQLTAAVETTNEDTGVEITFAEIAAQANAADIDGTVDAFVVQSLSSGTLLIDGAPFASGTNDEITATKSATWTPALDASGTLNAFTITAQDNEGAESTEGAIQATVNVTAVNDEPSFALIGSPNQTISQNAGTQTVSSFATDLNDGESGTIQVLTFHVSNDNSGIFNTQPAIDGTTGNLTFTPNASSFGKATVTVSLSDDGGTDNGGDDTSPEQTFDIFVTPDNIKINEVHASAATDEEFIEIFNTNNNATSLAGLVVVWFNGGDDLAYKDFDLTGSTNSNGFYVIGETEFSSKDQDWGTTSLQNGPDAVALYVGSQSDFTASSPVTRDGLVGFIVYGDTDDAALRAAFGGGDLWVAGDADNSISRLPDGIGDFVAQAATPQLQNDVTAPVDPLVTTPSGAVTVNAASQTISGTHSENDVEVHAYADNDNDGVADNATSLGSATVSSNAWSFSVNITADAINNFVVRAVDVVGNASGDVDVPTITEDSTSPTVTSVSSSTSDGGYKQGDVIVLTVNFNELVNVTGMPQLALETGVTDQNAEYASGDGTTVLTFNYTVQAGDVSNDLDYISTTSLSLNGATITDAAGNVAVLTLPEPGEDNSLSANSALRVDGIAPSIMSFTRKTPSGEITNADEVTFLVTFSEDVTGVDMSDFEVVGPTGATIAVSQVTASTYDVTVSGGDLPNLDGTVDLNLGGAPSITDVVGNDLPNTQPATDETYTLDNTAPTVTRLAPFDNSLPSQVGIGRAIFIDIFFSEAVEVTGQADGSDIILGSITLETGTTDRSIEVRYDNIGVFIDYQVQEGDISSDLSYVSANSFFLDDGATITDAAGNAAILILPEPGQDNSLSANSNTAVDGVRPTITSIARKAPTSESTNADEVTFLATFSEDVTDVDISDFEVTGPTGATITVTQLTASTYDVMVSGGDMAALNGTVGLNLVSEPSIDDNVGNDLTDILPATDETYTLDNAGPSISSSDPINGATDFGIADDITITFNEDIFFGTGNIEIIDLGDNSSTVIIDVTSPGAQASISDGVLTLDPSIGLELNTNYAVQIASTAIDDLVGNSYAGITDNTTLNFTTVNTAVAFTSTSSSGAESVSSADLEVTLNAISTTDVTVDYTVSGTATGSRTDYTLANGSLTISAGSLTENITIANIIDDVLDETEETVIVTLSNPSNAGLGTNQVHTYTINDDDPTPTIAFDVVNSNGAESLSSAILAVSLSELSGQDVTVDYTVSGTATGSGTDYTLANGTLTVSVSSLTENITISDIIDDVLDETEETVIVTLSNPSNAGLGTNQVHTYTINDDDPTPTIAFDVANSNGAESISSADLAVSLSAESGQDVTIDYVVTGTATGSGIDYTLANGTLTINAGSLTEPITVADIIGDELDEDDETVIVTLSNPTNANLGTNQVHTYTIQDDDDTPTIAFTSTTSDRAESVSSENIEVTLSAVSGRDVTVDYTVSGTATSSTDFTLVDGTLTFSAGSISETITIASIVDDAILEANETVIITLSSPSNADLGVNTVHTYTITDNDAASVMISDVSSNEDDGTITVTATLDNAVQGGFTVDVSTADGTATTADSDYTAIANQTLTFAGTAGETQSFTVTPTADTKLEADETITISQGNLAGTTLTVDITDGATITIANDDAASVTIAEVSSNENDGAITVTATLDNAVDGGFTVDVSTADGSATIADNDYTAIANQTLIFAGTAGETQTFTVTPLGDSNPEGNETIQINQSNLAGTTLAVDISAMGTVTILDDDAVQFSIDDPSITEGDDGAATLSYTVSLNTAAPETVSVDVSTSDGTATAGSDYTALGTTTLTFTPGQTSKTVEVSITGDEILEGNETVNVNLTNATGLSVIVDAEGVGTITNDDEASVTIADASGNEDDGTITVTATLDNAVQGGFTVDVGTADGTATLADSDYTAIANQTLIFAGTAGETQTFTVTPTADTKLEADETITISQSNLAGTTLSVDISDGATITIANDDAASVTIADVSGNEDDGTITVTATLDKAVEGGFTVDVSTADGSATTADSDYTAVTAQTLTFTGTVGETQTFTVTPTADTKLEADETITISQGNLASTALTVDITDGATITIANDDAASVTIADVSSNEDDGTITVTATLDNAVQGGFTVDVSTADGSATIADSDYTAVTAQTLTFTGTAGETQTFMVAPTADTKLEADETITISQSNLAGTTLTVDITDQASVSITNDDAASVTIADVGGAEDGTITVTATLDNAVQGGFSVDVSTADRSATTADNDYTAIANQTLTFAGTAGETQTFTVTPTADTKLESGETLTISQSNLAGTTLPVDITDGATITIANDDAASVTIADVSSNENDGAITVTATLDNAVDGGFSVDVSTADGSATIADNDYTAVTAETLTFAGTVGETQTFTVTPLGDSNPEGNETVLINQSNLAGTTLAVDISAIGTVIILDDDDGTAPSGYSVSMDDALINATEATATTFTFAGAEEGATYNYTVSSDEGGADVTGTGTITTATDQITLADLSGLNDGTLTLSVTLTDPSGNVGVAATDGASKDAAAPSAPVVSSITDDTGNNGADQITSDNMPDVNGIAEANSTVEVFVDGVSVGTTNADADGNWTMVYNGDSPREDGSFDVTAKATDAAGNTSTISPVLSVTVDATAPAMPEVTIATTDSGLNGADGITNDNTLNFGGVAESGSVLEIFIDGVSIGTTNASIDGDWSFDHTATTLADAAYSITAKATDAAGNISAESNALNVTVDTAAPDQPVVDLATSSDSGISSTDNVTNDATPTIEGTAEANATVEVSIDGTSIGTTIADDNGNWTLTPGKDLIEGVLVISAKATDAAGNEGLDSDPLEITIDLSLTVPTLAPLDDAVDVLPNTDLTMAFGENMNKGIGSITIRQVSDNTVLETIDVTSSKVSISGNDVTINPDNLILPPSTEFYVNIDAGALTDDAGNDYAGISNATDWSFTTIAASVVSSVGVPVGGTYGIGDNLDFTVNMLTPVTATGTATIPVTIGSSTVNATQVGTVSNSSSILFRYTVIEDELDADGIAVGAAINLNGGTMKDEFDVDAVVDLNGVGATNAVLVDGVRPIPTISNANTTDPVNGVYMVFVEFDEPVAGFSASDLTVSNGSSSNFTTISNDTKWSFDITPTADGTVSVSLAAGVATDNAGNASAEGTVVTKTFDGTAPEVSSITRKDADQLNTATTSADFRVVFSEDVLGVDLTDFEVALTGTTGALNSVNQVDAKTYDVNVNGISGQGTIGLNLKDDDSILDNAANKLGGTGTGNGDFAGDVYTTNFLPTDIISTPSSIAENNAIGDIVGALTSTDADTEDSHTYTLVSGTGDTDNASFIIDGTNLKAAAFFDFESKDSYSIRVKTDDGNGGSFEKALTITIDNVLEPSIFVTGDGAFDISALGLSQTRTLTVTNDGEKPVEVRVTSTPAGFSVLPGSLVLRTGTSAEVTVTFMPTAVGNFGGNIIFNHEGGNQAHPVSGEGAIITSVDDGIINATDIVMYPNPASRRLTIDLSALSRSKLDIEIVNTTGVSMFSKKDHTDQQLTLNVSGYEMGIYIVQFSNGQSVVRKKVMIKR